MFSIVVNEVKEFLRDKSNLFFMIMFPIILVFLLGNLLASTDKADETIGKIKLLYFVETEDSYQVNAMESFTEAIKDNKSISLKKGKDLSEAKKLAGKDKIAAVVLFSGEPMTIQVWEGSNQIKNRTVNAILNSYVQTNMVVSAVIATSPGSITKISTEAKQENFIQEKDLGVNRKMLDYYAVTMVAMIGFMSAIGGAGAFMGERQNRTINRLIIAPQNRVFLFLQKILGMVPQVVMQVAIIMLVSVLVFKAHYAATPGGNLCLFLLFMMMTLCMISIGAVVGLLIKTSPMAVLMPPIWLMLFFGGTYSKEINIKGLTKLMPNYQIQQAAFDLAVFGRYEKATIAIIICSLIMAGALLLGAFLFCRKEEER